MKERKTGVRVYAYSFQTRIIGVSRIRINDVPAHEGCCLLKVRRFIELNERRWVEKRSEKCENYCIVGYVLWMQLVPGYSYINMNSTYCTSTHLV